MNIEIEDLLHRIRDWHLAAKKTNAGRASRRFDSSRLPPQLTWTLLGLLHYRARKRKAWKMIHDRLPAQVAAEQRGGTVTIDEAMQGGPRGFLPGQPEWAYEFDGNYSFIENRVTGERLHVDLPNGPDMLFPNCFVEYLQKLQRPNSAVQRLLELFPRGRGLAAAINRLRDDRVLHVVDECDGEIFVFELCGVVNPFAKAVAAFLADWEKPANRPALGAVIGDWDAVQTAIQDAGETPDQEVVRRADAARQRWLAYLRYEAGGLTNKRESTSECKPPSA